VFDRTVKPVGASTGPQASPRRLLVSTVGDEFKLASAFERGAPDAPRVIGVSLKDRSAIMTVGRGADAAYWWDLTSGNFVTSTYYAAELPAWVQAFNGRRPVDRYAGQSWQSLDEGAATLGQMPAETGPKLHNAVNGSPFGNDLLADFAEEALVHERLGQRGATDLLSVSFSSNDSVGHTHGPDSPHVRDISIRTDRVIGRLLARVDKLVGLQHTIVALTADHGVAPLPEEVQARLQLGGRMTSHDLVAPIEAALQAKYGEGKWVLATAGSSPYLNHELIAKLKLDGAEVRRVAAEAVAAVPRVTRVYTREQLLRGDTQADRIGQRLLRSYNAERSGDLEVILEPYWLRQATGTTHGTAYNYDAHIPMILMGRRIKAGEYHAPVALNDLAPTIATLVGVEIPSASSGRILAEALLPPRPAPARSSR
jgi:hypothetical protein